MKKVSTVFLTVFLVLLVSACGSETVESETSFISSYTMNDRLDESIVNDAAFISPQYGEIFDGRFEQGYFYIENYDPVSKEQINKSIDDSTSYQASSKFVADNTVSYYFARVQDTSSKREDNLIVPEVIEISINVDSGLLSDTKAFFAKESLGLWFNDMYMVGNTVYEPCNVSDIAVARIEQNEPEVYGCAEIIRTAENLLSDQQKEAIAGITNPLRMLKVLGIINGKKIYMVIFSGNPELGDPESEPCIVVYLTYEDSENEYNILEK